MIKSKFVQETAFRVYQESIKNNKKCYYSKIILVCYLKNTSYTGFIELNFIIHNYFFPSFFLSLFIILF